MLLGTFAGPALAEQAPVKKVNAPAVIRAEEAPPVAERIIVTDLDDTLKPNKDRTFRGSIYPGARPLYRALDVGLGSDGERGDIHVVTARLNHATRDLNRTGVDWSSVSYGDLSGGIGYLFGRHGDIEDRKVQNVMRLMTCNPDSKAIFLGDNSEVDPRVYMRVMSAFPDRVEAVLIHRVKSGCIPHAFLQHPKAIVFEDFADAGRQLHSRGLITAAQLAEVLAEFE